MPEVLTSRYLFGPGPSNCYPEVTAALAYPVIGHLDPVFIGRWTGHAPGSGRCGGPGMPAPCR
ncbi:hypothetical protein ABH924_003849 [Arthrobacter sp. GAS37]